MAVNVGIKYIVDDTEYKRKMRDAGRESQRLTQANKKQLKVMRDINQFESRNTITDKRKLENMRKQNMELDEDDKN